MSAVSNGSFRLFRVLGITVFLHWSWFIVAAWQLDQRSGVYPSLLWAGLEYLGLFLIVLLHEFGHALGCRQVGGQAREILLWPLGGVAFVSPPNRPGPVLWSIAAGPLVNVALIPVFHVAGMLVSGGSYAEMDSSLLQLIDRLALINTVVLIFNLLPIYPLDGGQILRSLLWFVIGESRSLMVASVIGLLGGVAIIGLALWLQSIWIGIMALFAIFQSWRGLQGSRLLSRYERAPRHTHVACPSCGGRPIRGDFWTCASCQQAFDPFEHHGRCPHCGVRYTGFNCADCRTPHAYEEWEAGAAHPPQGRA